MEETCFSFKPFSRAAAQGQGLVLLLVFLGTTLSVAFSLSLMSRMSASPVMTAYADYFGANTMMTSAFDQVRTDILSKLNNSITVDGTYTLSGTVTAPHDPNNLGGTQDVIGTFTASMVHVRGFSYMVKVTTHYGRAVATNVQLMQLKGHSAFVLQPFSCNYVTSVIQTGNIVHLPDNYLTQYAQGNCMLITATPPAAAATSDGGTACGTQNGSGTLQLTSSLNCADTINGTYGTAYLHSGTSIAGGSLTSTVSNPITINIPGTIASGVGMTFSGTGNQTLLFGDGLTLTNNAITQSGSSGNNALRLKGTYMAQITAASASMNKTFSGSTGTNNVYIQSLSINDASSSGDLKLNMNFSSGSVDSNMYFDSLTAYATNNMVGPDYLNITGGAGNDTISCNGAFGTSPACTIAITESSSYNSNDDLIIVDGGAGNNFISLNTILSNTNVSGASNDGYVRVYGGGTGYNIIYVQGCTTDSNGDAIKISPGASDGSAGSGNNLVIVNTTTHCKFIGLPASAQNDVLLYHAGSAPASTFGRMLTY